MNVLTSVEGPDDGQTLIFLFYARGPACRFQEHEGSKGIGDTGTDMDRRGRKVIYRTKAVETYGGHQCT